jgi:hypothetical protein
MKPKTVADIRINVVWILGGCPPLASMFLGTFYVNKIVRLLSRYTRERTLKKTLAGLRLNKKGNLTLK